MRKKITFEKLVFGLILFFGAITSYGQVVTSSADDGSAGTLRNQIASASAGATITFDPSVSAVILTMGQITIDKTLTLTGNGISNTIVDGNANGRIFNVTTGDFTVNMLTLTNGLADNGGAIQVTTANLFINNSLISSSRANGASGSGGAIIVGSGATLMASSSSFTGNISNRAGGAIEAVAGTTTTLNNVTLSANNTGVAPATPAPGNGGSLHVTGNGTVFINNSTVSNNVAAAEGGGLWNGTGTMTISGATISGNTASGVAADNGGGGIYQLNAGTLIIQNNSIISNNIANGTAGSGGGILSDVGASLTVSNSSITGNRANRAGGGIEAVASTTTTLNNVILDNNNVGVSPAVAAPGNGGGLHVTGNGTVFVNGGQVQNNVAAAEGGGLWNGTGTMTISNTTINGNTASGIAADNGGGGIYQLNAGTLIIQNNSIISNNIANGTAGSGGGILSDVGASLTVSNSSITGNRANRAGGGIEAVASTTTTLNNVILDNNNVGVSPAVAAPGNGGGLHVTGNGTVFVNGGQVQNNVAAAEGGGLWNGTGTMTITGATISGNTASGVAADNGGGGIYQLNAGTLIIQNNSIISNNIANGTAGSGGGILSDVGASLTVSNSSITGNRANRAGGGIEAVASTTTTLNNVTLDNNNVGVSPAVAAPGNGGGFHITGSGNATITGGTVNNNIAAAEGGGLWNGSGTMSVSGSIVNGNTASGNNADNGGGGLYNQVGTLNVTNATVSNNSANGTLGLGGGILNDGATVLVSNSTISNNTSKLKGGGIATTNGIVTVDSNSAITSNVSQGAVAPTEGGGGIYIAAGTVNLTNASVSLNKAITGAGSGGGVFNFAGTLNATGSSITQNISNRAGGGIEAAAGTTTTLNNVSLNGNNTGVIASGATAAAPGNGGGFHITGAGNATITGGTNNNNTAAQEGGALWNGSGTMSITNSIVNLNTALGNVADDGGAGLFNNAGTLNLNNVTVTNNKATGTAGSGGGVFGLAGTISITNSTLNANSANRAGGAIEVVNGVLNIINSNLTNNDVDGGAGTPAPGNGGALHTTAAVTTTISGGNVTGNLARREGGGLWNQTGSTMTVSNVKIDSNIAKGNGTTFGGGGIFVNGGNVIVTTSSITNNSSTGAAGNGGGVHVKTGAASITTTTISGNSSAANGGGIFSNATLSINASTVANNTASLNGGGISNTSASVPTLKNTIVATNNASSDADVATSTSAFVSNGYNLIGKASTATFTASTGDIVGTTVSPVNPLLASLANNGGTTLTHALFFGSPAYNKGNTADGFNDQIGNPVFAGRRDIGAFESQNKGILLGSLPSAICGTTLSGWYATIQANYANGAQAYRFKITKVDSNGIAIAPAVILDRPVNNISLANVAGTTYNATYRIEISLYFDSMWQPYGPACSLSTPNPESTIGNQCGTTLSSFFQFVTATAVPNVSAYKFRVTRLNTSLQPIGLPQETTQSNNKFNLSQLSGILYATPYSVEVSLRNTDGTFLPYNTSCVINSPAYPTTEISSNQCSNYVVPSSTTLVFANAINGAIQYRFRLFNSNGYDTAFTNSLNRFTLNNFPGLMAGSSYSVQVAVKMPNESDFGPYGTTCSIVTPGGNASRQLSEDSLKVEKSFAAFAYPNPFEGNFKLELTTNSEDNIQVKVYDILGKLVEDKKINSSSIETFTLGTNFTSGVYNVVVSQGENTKTVRVIKR